MVIFLNSSFSLKQIDDLTKVIGKGLSIYFK